MYVFHQLFVLKKRKNFIHLFVFDIDGICSEVFNYIFPSLFYSKCKALGEEADKNDTRNKISN